jgi:hypothetical protein
LTGQPGAAIPLVSGALPAGGPHARLDHGAVRFLTRTGLDWTHKYPAIAAAVARAMPLGPCNPGRSETGGP